MLDFEHLVCFNTKTLLIPSQYNTYSRILYFNIKCDMPQKKEILAVSSSGVELFDLLQEPRTCYR